jgi:hypothetical protein
MPGMVGLRTVRRPTNGVHNLTPVKQPARPSDSNANLESIHT